MVFELKVVWNHYLNDYDATLNVSIIYHFIKTRQLFLIEAAKLNIEFTMVI